MRSAGRSNQQDSVWRTSSMGQGDERLKGGMSPLLSRGVVRGHEAGDAGVKDWCIWLLVQAGQVQDRRGVSGTGLANAIIWVDCQAVEVGGLVSMMAWHR